MKNMLDLTLERKNKILGNIISVNLIKKIYGEKEEDIINVYGIDKLIEKLYEILAPKKIDLISLNKSKTFSELIEISEKNQLFKSISIKLEKQIKFIIAILTTSKSEFWKNIFTGESSLKKEIFNLIMNYYDERNTEKYKEIQKEMTYQNYKAETKEFFDLIKVYKKFLENSGIDLNPKNYNEKLITIALNLIKKFQKKPCILNIFEIAEEINKGIDGLKELSQNWEEIIKEIEEGKSQQEWVRRFLIWIKKKIKH